MQWTNGKNAGFSTSDPKDLYLPIDTDDNRLTVETQEKDPNSLLNFVKLLLKLRKDHKAMGNTGDWTYVGNIDQPYPMVYKRSANNETFMVVLNPSAKKVKASIPTQGGQKATYVMGSGKTSYKPGKTTDKIELNGISCAIYKIE
jgi:maltose alpha-D-glucosyltransferase/alpha-amylase